METRRAISGGIKTPQESALAVIASYLKGSLRSSWSANISVEAVGDTFHVSFTRSTNSGTASIPVSDELMRALKLYREESSELWFILEARISKSNKEVQVRPRAKDRPKNADFTKADLWLEMAFRDWALDEYPIWFQEAMIADE